MGGGVFFFDGFGRFRGLSFWGERLRVEFSDVGMSRVDLTWRMLLEEWIKFRVLIWCWSALQRFKMGFTSPCSLINHIHMLR